MLRKNVAWPLVLFANPLKSCQCLHITLGVEEDDRSILPKGVSCRTLIKLVFQSQLPNDEAVPPEINVLKENWLSCLGINSKSIFNFSHLPPRVPFGESSQGWCAVGYFTKAKKRKLSS